MGDPTESNPEVVLGNRARERVGGRPLGRQSIEPVAAVDAVRTGSFAIVQRRDRACRIEANSENNVISRSAKDRSYSIHIGAAT